MPPPKGFVEGVKGKVTVVSSTIPRPNLAGTEAGTEAGQGQGQGEPSLGVEAEAGDRGFSRLSETT
jgi:hypothetical protein